MGKWKKELDEPDVLNNGHHHADDGNDEDDSSTIPLQPLISNGNVTIVPPPTNGCLTHNGHHMPVTTTVVDTPPAVMVVEAAVNGNGGAALQDRNVSQMCGVGSFKPKWLQPLANKKIFLAVFCLTSVLQGMYYTYFVSVLTTIEKLFQMQSKTTGIIMSATEMGQIGGALLLTYYGGQGHRPRWIACGMIIFAIASFLCSLPHFIFGAELTQIVHKSGTLNRTRVNQRNLCDQRHFLPSTTTVASSGNETVDLLLDVITNRTLLLFGAGGAAVTSPFQCMDIETQNLARITGMVLSIFFISLLFIGIGATAVYTLGIPYIDDNVANRDSPLYFAITIGVRILGPVFGFLLGSFCTSIYVYPLEDPIFDNTDPRWIGAWWLGLFIVAAALVVSSLAMFLFPKELPNSMKKTDDAGDAPKLLMTTRKKPYLRDSSSMDTRQQSVNGSEEVALWRFNGNNNFPKVMRRLLKNDILLYRTASSVLHMLPIAGLYTFLPKYIESQFRMTATEANMVAGIAGILVMGVGIFGSGIFMRRFKPNARFVAGWLAFTALAYASGMTILMFIGCQLDDFASQGDIMKDVGTKVTCETNCNCEKEIFAPVCTSEGVTYFSACHAGCQSHLFNRTLSKPVELFGNCTCLNPGVTATAGYCPLKCSNFVWFTCVFSIFVLIHSTSEVGSMLLTLRCVDPKDKAMALGLISFAIGLFGNVPCPIIYGAVVDSACLVWETICGERGACSLYDPIVFRSSFHGMTGAIMFIAFLVDVVVWYKAKNIKIIDEEGPPTSPLHTAEEAVPINNPSSQYWRQS